MVPPLANGGPTARLRRGPHAVGGGVRRHRGRPDYSHLAAAPQRFQRIPLAARYLHSRDSRRLDCAKSLLGVQIRIPGSDRVRSPCRHEDVEFFLQLLCFGGQLRILRSVTIHIFNDAFFLELDLRDAHFNPRHLLFDALCILRQLF